MFQVPSYLADKISFWDFQRGITPEREITRTRNKYCPAIFPWGIHIWNFKTLACTVHICNIWHALDFILIFSKDITPERDISDKKNYGSAIFPWKFHAWNCKKVACTVHKIRYASKMWQTDARSDDPKPVYLLNFFEVVDIKNGLRWETTSCWIKLFSCCNVVRRALDGHYDDVRLRCLACALQPRRLVFLGMLEGAKRLYTQTVIQEIPIRTVVLQL